MAKIEQSSTVVIGVAPEKVWAYAPALRRETKAHLQNLKTLLEAR